MKNIFTLSVRFTPPCMFNFHPLIIFCGSSEKTGVIQFAGATCNDKAISEFNAVSRYKKASPLNKIKYSEKLHHFKPMID